MKNETTTQDLQALQMLEVKVLAPTYTKDARVKIIDLRFDESITIPFDYHCYHGLDVAIAYLKKKGVKNLYGYGLTKEHYFLVVTPENHTFTNLKKMTERE